MIPLSLGLQRYGSRWHVGWPYRPTPGATRSAGGPLWVLPNSQYDELLVWWREVMHFPPNGCKSMAAVLAVTDLGVCRKSPPIPFQLRRGSDGKLEREYPVSGELGHN